MLVLFTFLFVPKYKVRSKILLHKPIHFLPHHGLMGEVQASGAELFNTIIDKSRHNGFDTRLEAAKIISNYYTEGTILDCACGVGSFTTRLRKSISTDVQIIGTDASQQMIKHASKNDGIEYKVQNIIDVSGWYDAITIGFLFHELPSNIQIEVLKKVLNHAGDVWILDVNPRKIPNKVNYLFKLFEPFIEEYSNKFETNMYSTTKYLNIHNLSTDSLKLWTLSKYGPLHF